MNTQPRRFPQWTQHALAMGVIAAVVSIFTGRLLFTNLVLPRGDVFQYFYPYWHAAAEALRAGDLPIWNTRLFMGAPLLANSQVGFFYPLNWPVWLLFDTPHAVSVSIVVHLVIAGWGGYAAGRRAFKLSPLAAVAAALLYALGGYVSGQVEHVNQLQNMAWLPFYLAVLTPALLDSRDWRTWRRPVALLTGLFTLQLLAGHTQTTFITGVGVGLWLLSLTWFKPSTRPVSWSTLRQGLGPSARALAAVGLAGMLAVLLAAVQLLPSLELTGESARQGGLAISEVVSFSLHPLLLSRALLPGYGQALFTEYSAFVPLSAIALAVLGAWRWRDDRTVRALVIVLAVAFVLALGRFTPLYWQLGRLPGFNLFRVPARWLVLYALSVALLAGVGLDRLRQMGGINRRVLAAVVFIVAALVIWHPVAYLLSRWVPLGDEVVPALPSGTTVLGWAAEAALFALLLWRGYRHALPVLLLLTLTLFAASRTQPYNRLSTPEVFYDLRPPAARLLAESGCNRPDIPCSEPAGRFLSLSPTFFDPGDQAEIDSIYAAQLDAEARWDYTVAIKQKEVIVPNLPLQYGLNSVDGFDGGILPLRAYSILSSLIIPGNAVTTDGRLREIVTEVPEARWLDLFNARYLITDRVGDEWRSVDGIDVFFDRQFHVPAAAGAPVAVGFVPDFEATGVWVVSQDNPGTMAITAAGQELLLTPVAIADDVWEVRLPEAAVPNSILLTGVPAARQVSGLALVDRRDGTFHPLVPDQYRLLYSGDVKIYENLDVQPRAFVVHSVVNTPDARTAAGLMGAPSFDPRETAVVESDSGSEVRSGESDARIVQYETTRIVVAAESTAPALLILTDAAYPGWRAAIDGEPVPIETVNILFRGVNIPAGRHEVTFTYEPQTLRAGAVMTVIALLFCIGAYVVIRPAPDPTPSV